MSPSHIEVAFEHHLWANLTLIDACASLTQAQLDHSVRGTYGSVLETLRHCIDGDAYYLETTDPPNKRTIDTSTMGLAELRETAKSNGARWLALVRQDPDASAILQDIDQDRFARNASLGLRMAQALQHATEHRTEVCTTLSALDVEPPDISVWKFGAETGAVVEFRIGV